MTVRLAIVGTGRMGTVHARTLAPLGEVDLVGLVEPAVEYGQALAEELGTRHYATFETLVAGDRPDAVLVASPTPTHPVLVRQALDDGLHVLCEKPLALELAAGGELAALAEERDLILQVGFWRRFSPPWLSAKRLIDDGAIGRPVMLRLSQWDAAPPPPAFCDPSVSGGLAIDCGVHEFDLAEWFTGELVSQVTAWNLPVVNEHVGVAGDIDNLVAVLELEGGAVATVDLSRNAGYDDDVRTEILGETGAIFIDLLPAGRARLADAGGVRIVQGSEAEDALAAGLIGQMEAFAGAIRSEGDRVPGGLDSSRAVAIGRAIQISAETGRSQALTL